MRGYLNLYQAKLIVADKKRIKELEAEVERLRAILKRSGRCPTRRVQ